MTTINSSYVSSGTRYAETPKDCCFKTFVIASIALATVAAVFGILAILACRGILKEINPTHLFAIGEVNGYLLTLGGIVLFSISIVSWVCQHQRAITN